MKQRYKHKPLNEWEQWDYEEWFHDQEKPMNPTPDRLKYFSYQYYSGSGFLDGAPQRHGSGTGFLVTLVDSTGWNEVDELEFDDEAIARRFIDWLVNNRADIDEIYSRTFTP